MNMKNQTSSKTLQNGSKSTPREAWQTQHQTQGKSFLCTFFENIVFRTYFINSHTLSYMGCLWTELLQLVAIFDWANRQPHSQSGESNGGGGGGEEERGQNCAYPRRMILRLSEVTGPRSFALAPSRDRGSESERPRTV